MVIQLLHILCNDCKINSDSGIWIFVEGLLGYWIDGNLFYEQSVLPKTNLTTLFINIVVGDFSVLVF